MPFDPATGIYTPPSGAENAAPGDIIHSAIWNSIFTDISSALTQVGQQSFVNGPRIIGSAGSFTVAATDNLIYIRSPVPTITMPLSALKVGPVKIMGATSTIFGSNNTTVVFSGGETMAGLSSFALTANFQTITLYPQASVGYLFDT